MSVNTIGDNMLEQVYSDVISKINNLDINNNIAYIFIHFKYDKPIFNRDIIKNGVCLVSILFNEIKMNEKYCIDIDLKDLYDYYKYNKLNDNILVECKTEYKKYTLKFIYLKNIIENNLNNYKWKTYFNIIDINSIYAIDSILNSKVKIIRNSEYECFFNTHINNKINLIKNMKIFMEINIKVIFKNMKKNKMQIENNVFKKIKIKKIKQVNTDLINTDLINTNLINTDLINNNNKNNVFIFIQVKHLFKDIYNLLNSGFLIISILFYKNNLLKIDSENMENYYKINKESNNIIYEYDNNLKLSIKLIYLDYQCIKEPVNWKWKQYGYILDKEKYSNLLYENNIVNCKLDIINNENVVKNRISMNFIIKNILSKLLCKK